MKPIAKQSNSKSAFTIVELLTVMSIIIILMGLLAPAMNKVRRHATWMKQKNNFHSISVALEMFRNEFDGYPDSIAVDSATPPQPYCGAMKLAEAMMGQDLLGFHPDSRFRSDGTIDGTPATQLYTPTPASEKQRKENVYLPLEQANAYRLRDIYTNAEPPFESDRFVLCDEYKRIVNITTGKRIGMPVLYFKANTSNVRHDPTDLPIPGDDKGQIYNYLDNDELVKLGMPWNPTAAHAMASTGTTPEGVAADPSIFYQETWNVKITSIIKPYRMDSFILMSAGFDGPYGTPDDVFNFDRD